MPATGYHRRVGLAALAGCLLALTAPTSPAAAGPVLDPDALPKVSATLSPGAGCVPASPDVFTANPRQLQVLRPEMAWPVSRGSAVTVAVVDTGVDVRAKVLAGRVDAGVDVAGTGDAGTDCVGHGTFVAGLIAAGGTAGTPVSGIAPRARILSIRATDSSGTATAASLAAGINAAAQRGAAVIVVSPSVPTPDDGLHAAVRSAVAAGSMVVAPSTMDGQTQPGQAYPAGFPETLSVGGIDEVGQRPSGEPAGARVDLVAPATALVSIGPGAGHFSGTGPSLAAALVGATAALVLAYHPGMGVAELMQRLETTAYHPSGTLPDALLGYGTVDPAAAVSAVLTPAQTSPGTARDRLTVLPPAPEHPERPIALAIAGALLLVLLLTGLTLLLPRPRRRHPRRRRPGLPRRGLPRPGLPHPRR